MASPAGRNPLRTSRISERQRAIGEPNRSMNQREKTALSFVSDHIVPATYEEMPLLNSLHLSAEAIRYHQGKG